MRKKSNRIEIHEAWKRGLRIAYDQRTFAPMWAQPVAFRKWLWRYRQRSKAFLRRGVTLWAHSAQLPMNDA